MPRALAIVGPTAAGKGALGREAARRFALPVLVCDSVKVYRRLDIGSAKPSLDVRAATPHRLLDLVDPDGTFSAGDYARAAHREVQAAQGRGLFVGGTGFYLRAVAWTSTGAGDPELGRGPDDPERAAFEATWRGREQAEPGALHRALAAVDPPTAAAIHPNNTVRLLRALWLCELGGGAVSERRRADPPRKRVDLMTVVLDPGRDALEPRIAARLHRMLCAGFVAEVEKLVADGYDRRFKAMRSLGYRQMLDVVEGRTTLEAATDAILVATRQFAKRQRTYLASQLPADVTIRIERPEDFPWARAERFLEARAT